MRSTSCSAAADRGGHERPGDPDHLPNMKTLRDPILLFRFALDERDWPLAGLLAGSLGRDLALRPSLERELRAPAAREAGAPRSLGALRALGALVRLLGLERGH
jgi:hypothetical protein